MRRAKLLRGLVPLLILLLVLAAWVLSCQKIGAPGAGMGARFRYIQAEVSTSHLPRLYEPFTITGTFTPVRDDIADAELWLQGGIYLDGEAYWHGPLKKGETRTLSAKFAFVTEGHTGVGAYGSSRPGSWESSNIGIYVSKELGQWGWLVDSTPVPSFLGVDPGILLPGGPFFLPAIPIIWDTSRLLNTSAEPRLEFVQSWDDVRRLQDEGLLPQELRYEWNRLHPGQMIDFSRRFLIIFWDGMKPTPGQMVNWPYLHFVLDGGIIRGGGWLLIPCPRRSNFLSGRCHQLWCWNPRTKSLRTPALVVSAPLLLQECKFLSSPSTVNHSGR